MQKKIKKILLIFPPVVFSRESPKQIMPPLGITYLAAYLSSEYEVKLLDAALAGYNLERRLDARFRVYGLEKEEIKKKIQEFSPDVVGVSCLYSSQFYQVQDVCAAAKELSRDIITVIGGTHPTFLGAECMKSADIDFIVLGEGEQTFQKLLDCLNQNKDYSAIDGLIFRKDDKIITNPKTDWIDNLDELPFPARRKLPLDEYFRINLPMGLLARRTPAMNIITSRGCPFKCSFCSSSRFWGGKYRGRSAENVLDEMAHLKKDLGVRELKFFDDNLTYLPVRAREIFQGMVDRNFKFSWNTPNGIDIHTLDEEIIRLMKQSGCYELTLAVESGDEEVLKNIIKKPFDLAKVAETARIIKRNRIDTYGFFIIGFPGETKRQIQNTLNFIDRLRLGRISLFIANPLPGTEIYDVCLEKGYLRHSASSYFDYFHSRIQTEDFDSEYLLILRRKYYWNYNLKLFLRNPLKFIRKYSIFIKRPLFLAKMLYAKLFIPGLKR
ncbi:MAG: radical SAM protein [Candidatus Omnitrophota bacterium]